MSFANHPTRYCLCDKLGNDGRNVCRERSVHDGLSFPSTLVRLLFTELPHHSLLFDSFRPHLVGMKGDNANNRPVWRQPMSTVSVAVRHTRLRCQKTCNVSARISVDDANRGTTTISCSAATLLYLPSSSHSCRAVFRGET